MKKTQGDNNISIGLIDGPVDLKHKAFEKSHVKIINNNNKCSYGTACSHGTFIFGLLASSRNAPIPGICPNCEIVLNPIFEDLDNNILAPTPTTLSEKIMEIIDEGVSIINLSVGISSSSMIASEELNSVFRYAARKGILIVIAAGNQGNTLSPILFDNDWTIPVSACDNKGNLIKISNFGPSASHKGISAPGLNIQSTVPRNQYSIMSGTSISSALVTGTISLLMSKYADFSPEDIKYAVLNSSTKSKNTIIPQPLNVEKIVKHLVNQI